VDGRDSPAGAGGSYRGEVTARLSEPRDRESTVRERRPVGTSRPPTSCLRTAFTPSSGVALVLFVHSERVRRDPRDFPFPWVGVAVELAREVAEMEHRGVLHRDIAPASVVISRVARGRRRSGAGANPCESLIITGGWQYSYFG
jgi:hypothetical protein